MFVWTDGFKLKSRKPGAVAAWKHKRLNSWREKRLYLGEKKQPYDAELWEISDALEVAILKTRIPVPLW